MPNSTLSITETLTNLLTHLVRFPTLTDDNATNRAALDWVEEQLTGLPLHVKRIEHDGFPSLIATTRPTKTPKLWLLGHMDVVQGPTELFEVKQDSDRLSGRGAFDMKYGLAVFIALLQELGQDLPKYDFGIMITSDEETGGTHGTEQLVNDGYLAEAVINPECGTSWHFETGAKGVTRWHLNANGRTAHGSRPWQGHNAIENLTEFIDHLKSNFITEPCGDPGHAHNTMNVGWLSGGVSPNQVPDEAEAQIDIRIQPGTTIDDIKAWVEAARVAVPSVEPELFLQMEPYQVPLASPVVTRFLDLAAETRGEPTAMAFSHGSGDARFFSYRGIPTLHIPPTGGGQHADDEWIDLSALTQFYDITRRFTAEYTKID